MDENLFSQIVLESETKKTEAKTYLHKRYIYNDVKATPPSYFVGISGLRGIGKTVLLLQLANETENSIYFSADASYLRNEELYNLIKYAKTKGYRNIFIDEIYYKENWQQDIKTAYDAGGARIFFSGSSAIEIKKGADLSRRAIIFALKPLSFREYLSIKKGFGQLESILPKDLFVLEKRKKCLMETAKFKDYFSEYCQKGGLFYQSDDTAYFYKALESTLERIVKNDLGHLRAIDTRIENAVYQILERIAVSPAGEANYSNMANDVSVSKPTVIRIVDDLVKIGLVRRVLPCGKSFVRKEPKLYLAFPFREFLNSMFARKSDIGALREEFFANHAENICYLKGRRGEKTPDFLFESKTLEIGGENKNFGQNPDFIVKEGISLEEKAIPLYLTGFLY